MQVHPSFPCCDLSVMRARILTSIQHNNFTRPAKLGQPSWSVQNDRLPSILLSVVSFSATTLHNRSVCNRIPALMSTGICASCSLSPIKVISNDFGSLRCFLPTLLALVAWSWLWALLGIIGNVEYVHPYCAGSGLLSFLGGECQYCTWYDGEERTVKVLVMKL